MGELPAGTITMFFSDIEGSTALLNRLGNQYGEALSGQRAVLRTAIAAWRGHEMGTEGDSRTVTAEARDAELSAGRALGQREATALISSVLHPGGPALGGGACTHAT